MHSLLLIPAPCGLWFVYMWMSFVLRAIYKRLYVRGWTPGDRVILHDLQFDDKLSKYNGECAELVECEKGKWTVKMEKTDEKVEGVPYKNLGREAVVVEEVLAKSEDLNQTSKSKAGMGSFIHNLCGGRQTTRDGSSIDLPMGQKVALVSTAKHEWAPWKHFKCFDPQIAEVQYGAEKGFCNISCLRMVDEEFKKDIGQRKTSLSDRLSDRLLSKRMLEDRAKEKQYDKMVDLWTENIEEGENDMYAIQVAFLVVQSLRYAVGGLLPNEDAKEEGSIACVPSMIAGCYLKKGGGGTCNAGEKPYVHELHQVFLLFFLSVLLLSSVFLEPLAKKIMKTECWKKMCHQREELLKDKPKIRWTVWSLRQIVWRLVDVYTNVGIMAASWGIMYATQWWLGRQWWVYQDKAIISVYLGIFVSLISMPCIWLMDKLADAGLDQLRQVQRGVGFLIGFTWEAVFDDSVDSIGETLVPPKEGEEGTPFGNIFLKAGLGIVCLCVILPAWMMYVIPMHEESGYKMGFISRALHDRIQRSLTEFVQLPPTKEGEAPSKHREAQLSHLKFYAKKLRLLNDAIDFYTNEALEEAGIKPEEIEEMSDDEEEEEEEEEGEGEEEEDTVFPLEEFMRRRA